MKTEFIPEFIKQYVRKRRIQKHFRGKNNRIVTCDVHPSAKLGHDVYLAKGVSIRENVSIDDYSYCSANTIIFAGSSVGKFSSIGYNVQIGVPEHPVKFFSTSPTIYRKTKASKYCKWAENDINEPARIGNNVWIGSNAVILQGVNVGNGAVVAAGAVVTKDVSPYAVVGGVPAKKIKQRLSEDLIEKLEKSKWWEHDLEWIEKFTFEIYDGGNE